MTRTHRLLTATCLSLLLAAGAGAAASGVAVGEEPVQGPFLVGAAAVSADPEPPYTGICLGGYGTFCSRPMTEILDPLFARALAITGDGGDGDTYILVTTTNVGLFATHKSGVEGKGYGETGAYDMRKIISERTGLPMSGVVIQSDHSHAGPDTIGLWGGVTPQYMELLRDAAAEAAVQAYNNREPATLSVAGVYETEERNTPADDEEWRVLTADSAETGERVATLVNFSSHATVLGSGNRGGASGDWTAWAAVIAEERYGGSGLATIGAQGSHTSGRGSAQGWDGGWSRSGTLEERKSKAVTRIHDFFDLADEAMQPVEGSGVEVDMRFIREQVGQPILAAIQPLAPVPVGPLGELSIERSILPPWLTGTLIGSYAGSARVGDVYFPAGPGEVFGEVNTHLKENVEGKKASFFIGAANDFLGYMAGSFESYQDAFESGSLWLIGCPDSAIRGALGRTTGCSDRWGLQASPTIGMHVRCVQEETALALGFSLRETDDRCAVFTAANVLPGGAD